MREGDDANVEQTLAESESVGAPDGESGVDDEVHKVCELVKAEVDGNLNGVMRGSELEVLAGDLDRDVDEKHDEEVDDEGREAPPERGEGESGEQFKARGFVRIEEARRPGDGEGLREFHVEHDT
jgi:hypothetical protein